MVLCFVLDFLFFIIGHISKNENLHLLSLKIYCSVHMIKNDDGLFSVTSSLTNGIKTFI